MTGKKNVSLPCAVGSTSYIDTVKNSYYVDKTLLIRDLIDDHAAVTLFTRPRRFGKTLNMSRRCPPMACYTISFPTRKKKTAICLMD